MFIHSLGELALGTRLKLLSDVLYEAADTVYAQCDAGIESRWFVYLKLLDDRGAQSVTDIARAVGTTQPAVSQLAPKLQARGLIKRKRDPHDERRTLLELTPEGKRQLAALAPVWLAIRETVQARIAQTGHDLMAALSALETQMDAPSLTAEILQRHGRDASAEVRIEPFTPALREHFYRLNAAWLEKDFSIEPIDQRVLSDPQREIIDHGGAVLFARLGQRVVGTCALKRQAAREFELTKMAVDEAYRGLGIGRKLLTAAIAEFRAKKGRSLWLESSTKLPPALHLYERMGFVHQQGRRPGSEYVRSDVYMIYQPPAARAPRTAAARARRAQRTRRVTS
jgi:DNA-binding MarR family transcriptional regulator/GNAT superfamily N-acetyltransferase